MINKFLAQNLAIVQTKWKRAVPFVYGLLMKNFGKCFGSELRIWSTRILRLQKMLNAQKNLIRQQHSK